MKKETEIKTKDMLMRHSITSTNYRRTENTESANRKNTILIKSNYQLIQVKTDDILFVKALSDYVIIKTISGKFITLSTMKSMVDTLPESFVRSHRSYIVNMDKINFVRGSSIIVGDEKTQYTVPIGRAYKKEFKENLGS